MNNGAISFDVLINNSDFQRKFDEMERRVRGMSSNAISESKKIDEAVSRIGTSIASYITFDSLRTLGTELIKVRGEFQSLETAFTTMLGSKEKANQLMSQIAQLSASTPYGLNDIATGTKMLMSYGTSAQNAVSTVKMLGDVASGVSAPLNDIAYLYGTLQSQGRAYSVDIRQFAGRGIPIYKELANVLNVSVGEVNNLVEAGKVGFPQVEQAFMNMTSAGGMFYKAMDSQSKTIGGLISNLKDNIDMMFNNIGKNQEGFISGTIKLGISATQNYEKIVDTLAVLVATYGAYKTAVILTTAVKALLLP
jgi:tape measure domain-containing protein